MTSLACKKLISERAQRSSLEITGSGSERVPGGPSPSSPSLVPLSGHSQASPHPLASVRPLAPPQPHSQSTSRPTSRPRPQTGGWLFVYWRAVWPAAARPPPAGDSRGYFTEGLGWAGRLTRRDRPPLCLSVGISFLPHFCYKKRASRPPREPSGSRAIWAGRREGRKAGRVGGGLPRTPPPPYSCLFLLSVARLPSHPPPPKLCPGERRTCAARSPEAQNSPETDLAPDHGARPSEHQLRAQLN